MHCLCKNNGSLERGNLETSNVRELENKFSDFRSETRENEKQKRKNPKGKDTVTEFGRGWCSNFFIEMLC